MDMLSEMFDLQKNLNRRIGIDTDNLTEEQRVTWVLNYSRALSQELAELIDSVPWKWWAKYQSFDKQNAKVEIIDLFHFLISLAQTVGLTPEDVHDLYTKKNKVNHNRQDSGYKQKDETDNLNLFVENNGQPIA